MPPTNSLFALLFVSFTTQSYAQGMVYDDQDWNTAFIDNCGLPSPSSIEHVRIGKDRKLRVTLGEGDKGKCSTDSKARHRAPFWERAELKQENRMRLGHQYLVSAEVTIESGFVGDRETFFQVHSSAHGCRGAYPPLMIKFHKGLLKVETLRGASRTNSGRHRNALRKKIKLGSLLGKPTKMEIELDTKTRPGRLSFSLGGNRLITDAPIGFVECAQPYVKFGIYRPGGKGSQASSILFDDLKIRLLK